jgi:hypothetical protein
MPVRAVFPIDLVRVAVGRLYRCAHQRPATCPSFRLWRVVITKGVLEPIGALGFFTRVGHAGTYFSSICQDGGPIRMRLCLPGESGGVVSKCSPLSEHEDYDWAIVPFEEYMHDLASPDFAPMIGTPKLQGAIERYNFGPLFSGVLKTTSSEELPDGQWKAALATRFDRTITGHGIPDHGSSPE